ncbi:hypothetical protein LF887_07160 [Chryseobacterium sp. MEBOG06]|uniref:hypothetical protein n=1 Tax=Chryseobacterium sp. MEBOG06 TaxID=2879938 RepID=UPI001F2DFB4E|nr:hypothetical protein [Chryseobacterium sp. MEBOG06]UKB85393.1 hypothetical protein LF887_07160 [Chryseobacterium sp. MEBOG06]
MLRIYYILLVFILLHCSEKKDIYKIPLSSFNVGISLTKNHLFLREYKRYLVISSKENNELESLRLKDDNGTGANSYLYDAGERYIIIDCDGTWYSIDKESGRINLIGKFWMKLPPTTYLGTFSLTSTKHKVKFIKEENIKLNDIYKYGGG